MEALKQENYELQRKVQHLQQMEQAYLDELEHLKECLHSVTTKPSEQVKPAVDLTYSSELEERARIAEEHGAHLTEELRLLKVENSQLKELLSTADYRLDTTAETSACNTDVNTSAFDCLRADNARLKEELDNLESKHRIDCSQFARQLAEVNEERCALREEVIELERHLKESRSELGDMRAQLEAMELLSNSATNNRGNSAFSEVEDRRIRAEKLVQSQRLVIEELRTSLDNVTAESKRKLREEVQKLEIRFRERDTKFTDNLAAERARLLSENRMLTLQVQQMEEIQLEAEHRAVELSTAFNFEGKNQTNLVKRLEKRIAELQRRFSEKSSQADGLRERVLSANLQCRQMQAELWKQMDISERLSKQLESYRKKGNATQDSDDNLPNRPSICVPLTATAEASRVGPPDRENVDPELFHASSKSESVTTPKPLNDISSTKQPHGAVDLRNVTSSQVKRNELPSDCKTS